MPNDTSQVLAAVERGERQILAVALEHRAGVAQHISRGGGAGADAAESNKARSGMRSTGARLNAATGRFVRSSFLDTYQAVGEQLLPACIFSVDVFAEFVRRHAAGLGADRGDPLAHLGGLQAL